MHTLSASQFSPEDIGQIFQEADEFRAMDQDFRLRREITSRYVGLQVINLFYQPSTRTRISSEFAAMKLGFGFSSSENASQFSSAAKGETIEDTVRVFEQYGAAAITLRTQEVGMANRAASACDIPIINAGDGPGEHPTQALLDLYTLRRDHGRLDDLHVVMGGDLKGGRTVRSLAQMLAKYPNNHITFVSVPELQIGSDIKTILDDHDTTYTETSDMYDALHTADSVYWTRLQKEYLDDPAAIPSGGFVIDRMALEALHKNATIMHPLPRIDEIHTDVDGDPRARYFQQAGNGLYIRMALLDRAGKLAVERLTPSKPSSIS